MGLAPNRSTMFAGDSAACEVPAPFVFHSLSPGVTLNARVSPDTFLIPRPLSAKVTDKEAS